MEEALSIGVNIGTLIAIGVSAVAGVVIAYGGFMYTTAMGDPQKAMIAKNCLIGAGIGMIIASLAFVVPRIIVDMVIKPVGGIAANTDVGLNCDGVLRNQLVFQRGASTADRMNVVISQIQSQQTDCPSDVWDPVAIDMNTSTDTGDDAGMCFSAIAGTQGSDTDKVGDAEVPDGLKIGGTTPKVRLNSGRDSQNNIIVYWSDDSANRPSDGASCWLYIARLRTWHENYF